MDNLSFSGHDFGLESSHQHIDVLRNEGEGLHFNALKLHANELNLNGVTPKIGTLEGHVNHLTSTAGVNSQQVRAHNGSIFSNGAFAYQHEQHQSQSFSGITPFVSETGSLETALQEFSVGKISLIGQTFNPVEWHAGEYRQQALPISDINHSFNLGGSWQDVLTGTLTERGSSIFSSWNVQSSKNDFVSSQAASLKTVHASHNHFKATIPIYHPSAGHELWKNWEWFSKNSSKYPEQGSKIASLSAYKSLPNNHYEHSLLNNHSSH